MPHACIPPTTVDEILATSQPDLEWTAILEEQPIPPGSAYGDVNTLKKLSAGTLPRIQATLAASRPDDIVEVEVHVDIPATNLKPEPGRNRVICCYPKTPSSQASSGAGDKVSWPVIMIFHGGGHTLGNPESELPLARQLVQKFNAAVVLPSYRLAPEHPFPSSFNDAFEMVKQIAADSALLSQTNSSNDRPATKLLPADLAGKVNPKSGFILAGTSAGATISTSTSHLYHKWRTSSTAEAQSAPPLTGLLLACGTCINPHQVPTAYRDRYLSRKKNELALPLDKDLWEMFESALRPNYASPIWSSFDQQPHLRRSNVGPDHVWLRDENVRVYFQVCGQDMSRDDSLIYERMLREEVGVDTRMDLYSGFGHVFWGMGGGYAEMEMSRKRMRHSVEGVGWLLGRDVGAG